MAGRALGGGGQTTIHEDDLGVPSGLDVESVSAPYWSAVTAGAVLVALVTFRAAAIAQTLCALIDGPDLSIPFVLGSADVGLMKRLNAGVPSAAGIVVLLALGPWRVPSTPH